jgi:uncharacterized membrane protein
MTLTAEDGTGAPVLLVLLLLVALFCLALSDAANVLLARTRAQTAADAAALAAAAEQWPFTGSGERDPASAARSAAQANGAELETCDCPKRGDRAHVMVSIRTRVRMLGVAPPRVRRTAAASVNAGAVFEPS